MIKTLIITFLVLYVVFKLTGFLVRIILRNMGILPRSGPYFRPGHGPRPEEEHRSGSGNGRAAKKQPNLTDGVGEYVEFEEVK